MLNNKFFLIGGKDFVMESVSKYTFPNNQK